MDKFSMDNLIISGMRKDFHKRHHFDRKNDVQLLRPQPRIQRRHFGIDWSETSQPDWIFFDNKILCFYADLDEIQFGDGANARKSTKKVKIYHFLENGTTQVVEHRINSGVGGVVLLKRSKVPMPSSNGNEFYSVEDFNVGCDVILFGRRYKITGCDSFTRSFLEGLGIQVPSSVAQSLNNEENTFNQGIASSRRPVILHPFKQFLQHDGHVLRFICHWENVTGKTDAISRQMVLEYFMADDTIQIHEVIPHKHRRITRLFLSRRKLPKEKVVMPIPGWLMTAERSSQFHPCKEPKYYKDGDLVIGSRINVLGRTFLICDCDEFTKQFQRNKYGITDFSPIAIPEPMETDIHIRPHTSYPAISRPKKEETHLSLDLQLSRPYTRNFFKFVRNNPHGSESALRFRASLDSNNKSNLYSSIHNFIIYYYTSDDTIAIFESSTTNSGRVGGRFLERCRVLKPASECQLTQKYYEASDFHIGAEVTVCGHKFHLIDADEFALRYMEQNSGEFPMASVITVLRKIKKLISDEFAKLKGVLSADDVLNTGIISFKHLRDCLLKFDEEATLSEHEIITIGRRYRFEETVATENSLNTLATCAQTELKRSGFDDFNALLNHMKFWDKERGYLSSRDIYRICQGLHLPLPKDLIMNILESLQSSVNSDVSYSEFVKLLNWKKLSHIGSAPKLYHRLIAEMKNRNISINDSRISYKDFVRDLEDT